MEHIQKLPPDLCCRPEPFILLCGLDPERNQLHRTIWRAFIARSRESDPIKFRCRTFDHKFPAAKVESQVNNELPNVRGILKIDWMHKHLAVIPAVLAVCLDLDWDDSHWEAKISQCVAVVESFRNSLQGRGCQIVVVLIQSRATLPSGEDPVAMERAQYLCDRCALPNKNLFVLSHTNLLFGCIQRLNSEFRDMALNYYHERMKKIYLKIDNWSKTSHQPLLVRYEFKLGFFTELKQNSNMALEHYRKAYNHLLELRPVIDTDNLEMKVVAGYINYKICRLSFQHDAEQAIGQFRRHIAFFYLQVGLKGLEFEHEAWLSKQFELFADLFQEAIQSGLVALASKNPGLYYQEAACHAIERRRWSLKHGSTNNGEKESSTSNRHQPALIFYGQRQWPSDCVIQDIASQPAVGRRFSIHQANIGALKCEEASKVDHSALILPLLEETSLQFKQYNLDRMRLYPSYLIAKEHVVKGDYSKALVHFSSLTSEFRREQWWSIYTDILMNIVRCSYIVGRLRPLITACIELLSSNSVLEFSDKMLVQTGLYQLFEKPANPSARKSLPSPSHQPRSKVSTLEWTKSFILDQSAPPKAILFRSAVNSANIPLTISSVQLTLTTPTLSTESPGTPGHRYCTFPLTFNWFPPSHQPTPCLTVLTTAPMATKDAVDEVSLWNKQRPLSMPERHRRLSQPVSVEDTAPVLSLLPPTWDLMVQRPHTSIRRPSPKLLIELSSPLLTCLVGECLPVNCLLSNNENYDVINISLSASISPHPSMVTAGTDSQQLICWRDSVSFFTTSSSLVIDPSSILTIDRLAGGGGTQPNHRLQVKCLGGPGQRLLTLQATYSDADNAIASESSSLPLLLVSLSSQTSAVVETEQQSQCPVDAKCTNDLEAADAQAPAARQVVCSGQLALNVVEPFEVESQVLSLQQTSIGDLIVGEQFILQLTITNQSPCRLTVHSTHLQLNPLITYASGSADCQISDLSFNSTDQLCECQYLVLSDLLQHEEEKEGNSACQNLDLGSYSIVWRRDNPVSQDQSDFVTTSFPLPSLAIDRLPVRVDAALPASGYLRQPISLTLTLSNQTPIPQPN